MHLCQSSILSRLWRNTSTNNTWQLLISNAEHHTDGPANKSHEQQAETANNPELRRDITLLASRTAPVSRSSLLAVSRLAAASKARWPTVAGNRAILAVALAVAGAGVCRLLTCLEGGVAHEWNLAEWRSFWLGHFRGGLSGVAKDLVYDRIRHWCLRLALSEVAWALRASLCISSPWVGCLLLKDTTWSTKRAVRDEEDSSIDCVRLENAIEEHRVIDRGVCLAGFREALLVVSL